MNVTSAFPLPTRRALCTILAVVALILMPLSPAGAAQGDGASSDALPEQRTSTSSLAPGDPATITFTGGGWGHGAGMSQYGAFGRAAAGKSYKAILRFYYRDSRLASMSYSGNVAVHVATQSATVLRPQGKVDLRVNNAVKATARAGDSVRVARAGSGWSVRVNGKEKCGGGCRGASFAATYADGTVVDVDGAQSYDHGKIRLVPVSAGSSSLYVVVAGLTMDEYLYGLAEMPSSWPTEALKAQAVAGRSFAVRAIQSRRADSSWTRPFDLWGTTSDQVYYGRTKSAGAYGERWVVAVDATSGQVATYGGEPIQAFYSSSHGGHSERSEYVFVSALPYIQAHPDPFDGHENPFHTWTRTYSIADLSRWLGQYGAGTLESIEIGAGVGESGRVNKATVILRGSNGTRKITGNQLRWRINEGVGSSLDRQLLSTKFEVSSTRPADEAPVGKWKFSTKVDSGPNARVTLRGWALDPDTSAAIRVFLTDNGGWAGGQVANDSRPGIAKQYGLGSKHGFKLQRPLTPGVHDLCVNARNHPDDTAVELQCRRVRVGSSPGGTITAVESDASDAAPYQPAVVTVVGRADDPDSASDIDVQVSVGASRDTVTAAGGRFSVDVSSPPGALEVCATALDDSGLRPDTPLGCVAHRVEDRSPVGNFAVSFPAAGQVRLHGWALDPDAVDPIEVRLLVDGTRTAETRADDARPAIAGTYGLGPAHGFDLDATLEPGRHRLCVMAVDATANGGGPTELGCRTKTIG